MSLTVKYPVTVRVRVTERWKLKVAGELQEALRRAEHELGQLEAGLRRLEGSGEQAWREHAQNEIRRLRERRAQILEQLRQLARVEPGTEVVQGQVEGLVRVGLGDCWDLATGAEVVLQDGVVVEIRSRGRSYVGGTPEAPPGGDGGRG